MDGRSAVEGWQDEELVKAVLERHAVMKNERYPWEDLYRQVERRVDPVQMGGYAGSGVSPGRARGTDIFDATAMDGCDRYVAAMGGMNYPRGGRWHGLVTTDSELNKIAAVQRWCEYATDRLFAMRYNPEAGFETQIHEDLRMGGIYGTEPLWVDENVNMGHFFYKALHPSEVWIDEDYRGRVDTVHREFERSARQIAQEFPNAMSQKMQDAIRDGKDHTKFTLIHCLSPNAKRVEGAWDYRGKKIQSLVIAPDEKWILRRSGYHSMPLLVSRVSTSPRDKYGRSPAMKVLGPIKGVNEMAKTILRAGHKAADPAILFHDDGMINKFSSRPGGMNPGMIDEMGRVLARPLESGGNLPFSWELIERERKVINTAFLGEFFWLLTEGRDRMTATEVLEVASKQGMLVAPLAGRRECEKSGPLIARELDMGLRSGQILPPPPELREARAGLRVVYDNPLSRMARAEEAAGFARWSEMILQLAAVDEQAIDIIDTDAAGRGLAEVLGVRPSWVATPEMVASKREARAASKQTESLLAGAPGAAGAVLDLAKASQLSEQGA